MKIYFRQIGALVRLSFVELVRRNEIFGLLLLAGALLVPLSMASPFGAKGASRYLDEVALLLIWGFSLFIALGTGSRLFPPEFEARTIYPLLAKPISRFRLLLGKYCGAVAATWSALALFYVLYAGSTLVRGGVLTLEFAQGFLLHLMFCAFAVAFVLCVSLIVTRSAALTFSGIALVAMFFFGRKLPVYAEEVTAAAGLLCNIAYIVGPHVEFFDMRQRMIHGWGPVDATVLLAVFAYALVYISFLLFVSSIALKRKKL